MDIEVVTDMTEVIHLENCKEIQITKMLTLHLSRGQEVEAAIVDMQVEDIEVNLEVDLNSIIKMRMDLIMCKQIEEIGVYHKAELIRKAVGMKEVAEEEEAIIEEVEAMREAEVEVT